MVGSAEMGVDVFVAAPMAVDQENNVGVVARREGGKEGGRVEPIARFGARYRDGSWSRLHSNPQGTEVAIEKVRNNSGANNESNYLVGPICVKAAAVVLNESENYLIRPFLPLSFMRNFDFQRTRKSGEPSTIRRWDCGSASD